jgi:hypothetical protein
VINVRKRFTAYVVFVGSENRNWWRFFLRRGWRHVYVILPAYYPKPGLSAVAYSQVINPWTDHVRSDVLFQSPRSVAEAALKEGATCVISLPVDQKFSGKYLPRGLLTCVSLTKALLSVGAWHVWTPEQLARWLLRNGGELMEKPPNVNAIQQAKAGQERAECADGSAEAPGSGIAAAKH